MNAKELLEEIKSQKTGMITAGRKPTVLVLGYQHWFTFNRTSLPMIQVVSEIGLRVVVNKVVPHKVAVL